MQKVMLVGLFVVGGLVGCSERTQSAAEPERITVDPMAAARLQLRLQHGLGRPKSVVSASQVGPEEMALRQKLHAQPTVRTTAAIAPASLQRSSVVGGVQ